MDAAELKQILEAYGADIPGIADRFTDDAELYLQCYNDLLGEDNRKLLAAAMKAKDYEKAFEAAHALKGLTGNLGLTPLYGALCKLVESLRVGEYGGVKAEYRDVCEQLDRVQRLIAPEKPEVSGKKHKPAPQARKNPLPRQKSDRVRIHCLHKKASFFVFLSVITVGVLIAGVMLVKTYRQLNASIQTERAEYIDEIAIRIAENRSVMESEYTQTALSVAESINRSHPENFADVRSHILARACARILFGAADGTVCDYYGRKLNPEYCADFPRTDSGSSSDCLVTLDDGVDYWIFSAPLKPTVIEGREYTAVYFAVSETVYGEAFAAPLFDGIGASFVISADGTVLVKPGSISFIKEGGDVFEEILSGGADPEDVEKLRAEFALNSAGSADVKINGERWLISYRELAANKESVIVVLPLTRAAAQTYQKMMDTILLVIVAAALLAISSTSLILNYNLRDRERRRAAAAVTAKSDFLSKMSHDMRTPLNAIIGLQTLAADSGSMEEIKKYLGDSAAASNYLLSIINDVLDMSRIESGKMTISSAPFELKTILAETEAVIRPMAADKDQILTVSADGDAAAYLGDSVRIKQILVNLLNNSVKFTKPGGKITLFASSIHGEDVDELTFEVADSGIGMSDEFMNHIFMPFEQERSSYTQQFSGSGLGLSIVNSLVKLMNGSISVRSKLGVGSSFTVKIPLARTEGLPQSAPLADGKTRSFEGKRVLIVEDNTINLRIAVDLLTSRFGITAETASDGKQALDMVAASAPGYYDLVLMDVKMPVMDGLMSAREIRRLNRPDAQSLPIVALSANAFDEDIEKAFKAGMNDYLAKPINTARISEVFTRYMGE